MKIVLVLQCMLTNLHTYVADLFVMWFRKINKY